MTDAKNFIDAACALLADPETDSKVDGLFKLTKSQKPILLSEKTHKELVPFKNGSTYYKKFQEKTYSLGNVHVRCQQQDKQVASIEICDPQSGQKLLVERGMDGTEHAKIEAMQTIETPVAVFKLNLN